VAILFQALEVRGPRRLRLLFTNTLDSGAFVTSWFGVESLDGAGPDPVVKAALVVPATPAGVEIVLDEDLAQGGLYRLTIAAGVPATDASTLSLTTQDFRPASTPTPPSPEVQARDVLGYAYGVDLVHDGNDFVEQANGDLDWITGPENVRGAVERGVLSEGVPWDPSWGAHPRQFVDAPIPTLGLLRSAVVRHLQRDDRIQRSDAVPGQNDNDGSVSLDVSYDLIGGQNGQVTLEPRA